MAAMGVVMPSRNSCIAASTCEVSCAYRAHVKPISLHSVPVSRRSRNGNGRTAVFSSGGVRCKEILVSSSSTCSRVGFRTIIGPQLSADNSCSSSSESRCEIPEPDLPITCLLQLVVVDDATDSRSKLSSWTSQDCIELFQMQLYITRKSGNNRQQCSQTVGYGTDSTGDADQESKVDGEQDSPSAGVGIAIKILKFYKREISPILPGSCRFVPTCSEYGMQAFRKYGVLKGAILTAWRLSRCNPLGGSGFDPPRWFDEPRPPPYR